MSKQWRLPTRDELDAMYVQLHVRGRGGFKPNGYWSSAKSKDVARIQYFNTGKQIAPGKINHHRVRLIQDLLENEISPGLVCFFRGKSFRVAEEDEPALMTWDEAIKKYGVPRDDNDLEAVIADRDKWERKAKECLHRLDLIEDTIKDGYPLGSVRDVLAEGGRFEGAADE